MDVAPDLLTRSPSQAETDSEHDFLFIRFMSDLITRSGRQSPCMCTHADHDTLRAAAEMAAAEAVDAADLEAIFDQVG